MWFAENKSWSQFRRSLGSFSAIVLKDGSTVWAEDPYGKTIASGEAGVDDASVIQSALDAVEGVVFLRKGLYYCRPLFTESWNSGYIKSALKPRSNQILVGEGDATILKIPDNTLVAGEKWVFRLIYSSEGINNLVIKNLKIDCNYQNQPEPEYPYVMASGIWIRNASDVTINGVTVINANEAGIVVDYSTNIRLYNNHVKKFGLGGLLAGYSKGVILFNNLVEEGFIVVSEEKGYWCHALGVEECSDSIATANVIRDMPTDTIIEPGRKAVGIEADCRTARHLVISDNVVDWINTPPANDERFVGIEVLTGETGYTAENIHIIGNIVARAGDGMFIEAVDPEGVRNLSIEGNYIFDVQTYGIYLHRVREILCNNNFISSKSTAIYVDSGNRVQLVSNYLSSVDAHGAYFAGGSEGFVVANFLYECHNGIGLEAINRALIINNIFRENDYISIVLSPDLPPSGVLILGNDLRDTTTILIDGADIAEKIKDNINYPTENSGTATFSGDGTTTQFSIAHGLVSAPTKIQVTPMTADAASDFYVTADDTYIYINYKSAPPSGTDNLKFSWYAEV